MRGHVVAAIVLAVLAVGLWRAPAADPARAAALRTGEILAAQVAGPDGTRSLGERLLESSSVRRGDDGDLILWLNGLRVRVTLVPTEDLDLHALGRRSLIAGLRALAAERGETLQVAGELWPSAGGMNVLVTLDESGFGLRATSSDGSALEGVLAGWRPPRRSSLVPPLLAIALAVLFRRPVPALLAGLWCAAFLLRQGAGLSTAAALARSLPDVATRLVGPQLAEPGHLRTLCGVLFVLAMVGVIARSGGVRGLTDLLARAARGARGTQVATWLMGLLVCFDDRASCLLVGTTMRPLSDRFRISREKLAYLVDSTAAPVVGLSLVSAWMAFEVATVGAQLPAAKLAPSEASALLLQALPYRFYCILTLVFSALVAFSGRDFGPMLAAERRARRTGQLVRAGARPLLSGAGTSLEHAAGLAPRARNALVPLAVFAGVALLEIVRTGAAPQRAADAEVAASPLSAQGGLAALLGRGDGAHALLFGAGAGLLAAVVLALVAGLGARVVGAAWSGMRSAGFALALLVLAWTTGAACAALGTGSYLTAALGEDLSPNLLPAILFCMAAAVAFATGGAWGTMAILLPLVVGMAFSMGESTDLGSRVLMLLSIAAVLEGSIFGDHCSPISDTTVLASAASASDHVDHVRTQLPYAVLVMLVSLAIGFLPSGFTGAHPLVALAGAAALLAAIVFFLGKRADEPRMTDAS